jgi:AhpD family alkylhydroperoxidase
VSSQQNLIREDDMTTTHDTQTVSRTARVPLEHPGSLLGKIVNAYSRRQYGLEAEPAMALLHQPKVLTAISMFGMRAQKWSRLDSGLKELASLLVASRIGCSWCMDFGYYLSRTNGMAIEKLERIVDWRDSSAYTALERKVLEYADAMTATPPTVTDEMVASLREDLDDAELVELTAMIAAENLFSRTNSALGVTSQGFKSQCDLRPVTDDQ